MTLFLSSSKLILKDYEFFHHNFLKSHIGLFSHIRIKKLKMDCANMSLFQINKSVEYGIALMASFKNSEPLSLREISEQKHLPLKFLEQIANNLKKEGILGSKEGLKGGYFLTKKPQEISLREIVEAIEGKRGLVNCIHGDCLLKKTCLQKNIWLKLQTILEKELEKIKLTDLVS